MLAYRKMLLIMILLIYIISSIGVPLYNRSTVSCSAGFFWETHMIFLTVVVFTKMAENMMFERDYTISGRLSVGGFMKAFALFIIGFSDGYTDCTAIVIAHSCPDELAQTLANWMTYTYIVGVVFLQWVVMVAFALRDPSHACLMKLVHMDAAASCISLPAEYKSVWTALHMARTFGEDIPQAILQTIYVMKVKRNYFLFVSIAVGVASSFKAVYDAANRALAAIDELRGLRISENEDASMVPSTVFLVVHGVYSIQSSEVDPYVAARVGNKEEQTPTINGDSNPIWTEGNRFTFLAGGRDASLELEVLNRRFDPENRSWGVRRLDLRMLTPREWSRFRLPLDNGGNAEIEFGIRVEPTG